VTVRLNFPVSSDLRCRHAVMRCHYRPLIVDNPSALFCAFLVVNPRTYTLRVVHLHVCKCCRQLPDTFIGTLTFVNGIANVKHIHPDILGFDGLRHYTVAEHAVRKYFTNERHNR